MQTYSEVSTYHGIMRVCERRNIKNPREAERNIMLALTRGKHAESFKQLEQQYLKHVAFGGCEAVAYNDFCYIVNPSGRCVTSFRLPKWFGKKTQAKRGETKSMYKENKNENWEGSNAADEKTTEGKE